MELHDHSHLHAETRTCSLFYHDTLVELLLSHPIRPVFFGICMSSCFLFWETFPWRLGSIWITKITHLMMDDFMSPHFRPTIYLMPYWGIFRFEWDSWIFMELHDRPHLRNTHRDKDLFIILSWSSSGALLEPFSLAHIFRHSDVIIPPLLRYAFFICESDSIMDVDD